MSVARLRPLAEDELVEHTRYDSAEGGTDLGALSSMPARLELVALFDDDDRRVPVHLGKDFAACITRPGEVQADHP